MVDIEGNMDLTHVSLQPNLDFLQLDLFSREAPAVLHDTLLNSTYAVAVGIPDPDPKTRRQ